MSKFCKTKGKVAAHMHCTLGDKTASHERSGEQFWNHYYTGTEQISKWIK